MAAIHQFVPTYEPGAVGAHMLEVQGLARELGFESEVFAEHVHPTLHGSGRDYRDYGRRVPSASQDVLLYQTAIGSPVADFVSERPETIAVNYHNITPARFFAPWEPSIVPGLLWGRAQLAAMAPRSSIGIAVSRYNQSELDELGYRSTTVVPVLVDLASFDLETDEPTMDRLRTRSRQSAAWLFVGRVAPNKAQHDLIRAFALYQRVFDPHAVLRIVGGSSSTAYLVALKALIGALGLEDSVDLTGSIGGGELAAHYRAADVFVCVSEHEGFCVPLLEAMHHRLPIVAYGAAAVPETLGAGGLCLPGKAPALVAGAVDRVLRDRALRAHLSAAAAARLAEFELPVTRGRMASALCSLATP